MTTPDPTTIGVLATTITGLTTAIGVLWKTIMSHVTKIETKLEECEEDRKELWQALADQSGQDVSTLQQRTRNGKK